MTTSGTDVLIVDDDEEIRQLLCVALTRAGLTCDTASDGMEALERLRKARYCVILTDLMMPRLDGAGFVKEIAALELTLHERPIILIMTAFPEREHLPEVGELVQAIVPKPFDVEGLAELVQSCVAMRRRRD